MHGCQSGTKRPALRAKQGKLSPVVFNWCFLWRPCALFCMPNRGQVHHFGRFQRVFSVAAVGPMLHAKQGPSASFWSFSAGVFRGPAAGPRPRSAVGGTRPGGYVVTPLYSDEWHRAVGRNKDPLFCLPIRTQDPILHANSHRAAVR
jgi:hypothetical protein